MDADKFYEEFKDALRYLGLPWGYKDRAEVQIADGKFLISYSGRTATISVPVQKD